jgi:hypothetical protein
VAILAEINKLGFRDLSNLAILIVKAEVFVLNKEEEIGCLEILKNNFPDLKQQGIVIGLYEFLLPETNLKNFICREKTVKEATLPFIQDEKPYIVLDESEGYKCIFFRGNYIKAQYDVTHAKMLGYVEETF